MDDPDLSGLMFLMQSKDVGSGFDIMNDQGFLKLFGEQDMFLEEIQLKRDGVPMNSVDARLTDGSDLVFPKEILKVCEILLSVFMLIKPPRMDAVAVAMRR